MDTNPTETPRLPPNNAPISPKSLITPNQRMVVQCAQILVGMQGLQSLGRLESAQDLLALKNTTVPGGKNFDEFLQENVKWLADKLGVTKGPKGFGLDAFVTMRPSYHNLTRLNDTFSVLRRDLGKYQYSHIAMFKMIGHIFGSFLNDAGEVPTPMSIVETMLDRVSPETWRNSKVKFLDPACGSGSFLLAAFRRFMVGLEKELPDASIRAKHIVENMLYGFDTNDRQLFFANALLRGACNCATNLFKRDTLSWEPDMKFDVICGNPPFNASIKYDVDTLGLTGLAREAADTIVYEAFAVKCYEHLRADKGQIALIFPSKWMQLGSHDTYREWLKGTTVQNVHQVARTEWNNGTDMGATTITYWGKDSLPTVTQTGHLIDSIVDTPVTKEPMPVCFNDLSASIWGKVQAYGNKIKLDKKPTGEFAVDTCTIWRALFADNATTAGTTALMHRLMRPGTGKWTINLKSQAEVDAYQAWWYEPLPNFLMAMMGTDLNVSRENCGSLPDIIAILKGRPYDRQTVYNELGITLMESTYLEAKIYRMANIDGVENLERARNPKRQVNPDWLLP